MFCSNDCFSAENGVFTLKGLVCSGEFRIHNPKPTQILQAVMTFDYFHMSHAYSVFPVAVFSYNQKSRTYVPAKRRFSAYVLEDIENDLKALELASRDVNAEDVNDRKNICQQC